MYDAVSPLVSAGIAAVVAYLTSRAVSYSKDVVQERQKWREIMRRRAVDAARLMRLGETQSSEYEDIVSEFVVRLNPNSEDDRKIILTLRANGGDPEIRAKKLLAQVSRLLKHDWERVKYEASPWFHLRMWSSCKPNEADLRHVRGDEYLS